jgi:DAACS family dicarboxylate/amino acid:cation (Na+ or H+) symporter
MSAHLKMLLGIAIGAVAGLTAHAVLGSHPGLVWFIGHITEPGGKIFLRLLFMLVIPTLFSAVVVGICGLDLKSLGRIGLKTLGYTAVVSAIAVVIGMTLVNVIRPGDGLPEELRARAMAGKVKPPAPPEGSAVDFIVGMFPDNPVKAAANGDMIGLILFSVAFGIGLSLTDTGPAARLRELVEGLYDVSMTLVSGVLKLAPLGVAFLLFTMTGRMGADVLRQLFAYVAVVLLALGLHMFVVYSLSVKFLGGRNPVQFFKDIRLAIATAFATSSSSATLPTALKVAEENLKLPPQVSRFVLTAGSAMNQNGTALFEGVTVLFLAQLFDVPLDLSQQALIMLIAVLGGIGTAGVPAGSLPVIAMILGMFGIPLEGLGLILGVDRLLDMCRTTLNVTGDLAAAVYVARGEAKDNEESGIRN